MARVLVLGATGYVGGRLIPRLLEDGHSVDCLVRDRRKLDAKAWKGDVEIFQGDVLDPETLKEAFARAEIVYYLIHSMGMGEAKFEELDRQAATNVVRAAESNSVKRIIYLGGLGKVSGEQSPHLRSRNEVGKILGSGSVPATIFRAAVIVGSGSLSFELIHHLVNRLPVMVCPRWIYSQTQPIGITDVIDYLRGAITEPASAGRSIDIGGPDIMNYGDMIKTVAKVLNLKRALISVPVLTPRLSSYWVNLVTPIPSSVAGALIESMRFDTVCDNSSAAEIFDIKPVAFEEAVRRALKSVAEKRVETAWTGAGGYPEIVEIDPSHLLRDRRSKSVNAPAEKLFGVVSSIGGKNGWYFADWIWKFRGFIDQQIGGVGLRRGRRHPTEISVGETLDFWRVDEYIENRQLRLKAEMRVGGHAWMDFKVDTSGNDKSVLIQTAEFYPRGLFGLFYWYGIYPVHALVFRGLIRAISRRAEQAEVKGPDT